MASGDTLVILTPLGAELPASNYGSMGARNAHPHLAFDTTTQEIAFWSFALPANYAGNGLSVTLHWMTASGITTGTVGWDLSIERMSDGATALDSDNFATAQTVTAATVPGTSGVVKKTTGSVPAANMNSAVAGDSVRLRVRRDVANDNAAGDAQLILIEVKEA